MKKISFWLFVFVFLLSCSTAEKKQENVQEPQESISIPPIKLSEYIIGPGDVLGVQVWRHKDLNQSVKVQLNGNITFPLVGDMHVSGMPLSEFQIHLSRELDRYIVNPYVSIQVTVFKSNKIYVLGEVLKPGIYFPEESKTVSEAIALAGGFTLNAKRSKVVLFRANGGQYQEAMTFDIKGMARGMKDGGKNMYLQKGDIVYVPLSNVALADRFFGHLSAALAPLLGIQQVVIGIPAFKDVVTGKFGEFSDDKVTQPIIVIPITP